MDLLPNELIIVIFSYIQKITDKRQFLKTCIHYNILTTRSMSNYERNYRIPNFTYPNYYCVEKFTFELCHDSYFNLIPDHYINNLNTVLIPCLGYYNYIPLLEVAKSKGYYIANAIEYGAQGGHIPILDWCYKNNKWDLQFVCAFGIQGGHIHVLKWLQEHDYEFNIKSNWMCNRAAQHGHLEILKFLCEIGCNLNDFIYGYALQSGNQELINWILENDCPTNVFFYQK